MNSRHQGFKKLVLGTTLMCCAGMSTVEAGPWDWLKNLFAGGEIAKLSKDVVRLEQEVKFLERSNKVKACIIVAGGAAGAVAGYYYFSKKQPGTAENAIQIGETLIPLQQEEETPVLALEEEQGETQVQDLNTAENETRTENEAPVQPRVVLVIGEAQDLALCIEKAEDDLELQKIARNAAGQAIQGALEKIGKRERACKNWALLVRQEQKRVNLKAILKNLRKNLRKYRSQLAEVGDAMGGESLSEQNIPQFVSALIETNRNLSAMEKDNSKTIKLQEENIKKLIVIIQDGERIAMEILKRCGQSFVPTQGYRFDLQTLERENAAFLTQNQSFPLVQYVPSTRGKDVETKSEVENLSSSLDLWNQCLSGVKEKENQSKEAIAREREKTSKAEESLKSAQAETSKAVKQVEELSRTKDALQKQNNKIAGQVSFLEKAKEDSEKRAKALEQEKDKVEEKNKQLAIEKQQADQRIATLQSQNNNKILTKEEEDVIINRRIVSSGVSIQKKDSVKQILGIK